jgi:hypothetical protein
MGKNAGAQPAIPLSMKTYFDSFTKGSQGYRKVIGRIYNNAVDIQKIPTWTTFKLLTGLPELEGPPLKSILGFWNFSGQSNTMREFIFKYFNNQLGLNTRVSHFVANHSRNCTFCVLKRHNYLGQYQMKLLNICLWSVTQSKSSVIH